MNSPVNRNPFRLMDPWKIALFGALAAAAGGANFYSQIPHLLRRGGPSSLATAFLLGMVEMFAIGWAMYLVAESKRESRRFAREQYRQADEISHILYRLLSEEIDPLGVDPAIEPELLGDGYGVSVVRRGDKRTVYTIEEARTLARERHHLNAANSAGGAE